MVFVRDFVKSFVLNEEIAGLLAIEQVQNEIVDMFYYDFEWIYDEEGNRVCRVTATKVDTI